MITLVFTLCQTLIMSGVPICVDEEVANSEMPYNVGKVDNQIAIPGYLPQVAWISCQIGAQQSVDEFMKDHPQYHGWQVSKLHCVPGQFVPNKRA